MKLVNTTTCPLLPQCPGSGSPGTEATAAGGTTMVQPPATGEVGPGQTPVIIMCYVSHTAAGAGQIRTMSTSDSGATKWLRL